MRTLTILAATAAALIAVPAAAQERSGEGRIEARGGVAFASGNEEAFAGVEAGYDFDLGTSAFIGIQASADKVLVDGADVFFGIGGRVGTKLGTGGKLYALGGYGFADGSEAPFAGVGYQHKFGGSVYGKVEYRRTLDQGTDVNFAGIGLGVAF
ncbi:MAG: hypothetical protein V4659_01585 [Pseudomonadota bacterium]